MAERKIEKILVFLGPPGSGKGTQAELLADEFGWPHISTGDLFRAVISSGADDAWTKKIKERYDAGKPQPDSAALELVRRKLKELSQNQGIIFDSFPLSLGQAKEFEKILKKLKWPALIVFYIGLSEKAAVRRLNARKICPRCQKIFFPKAAGYGDGVCIRCKEKLIRRSDDKPAVVAKRYKEYVSRLRRLLDFYRKKGQLVEINGEQTIEKIHSEIAFHLK